MKLLFVVHQFFPACHSGTEQYCLATAREARRRGHEVVILSLEPNFGWDHPEYLLFEQPYDGFRVPRLRYWGGLEPNDALRDYQVPGIPERFEALLDDVRPDAVHVFHLRFLGSDLLEVVHRRGVRSVVQLMDFWFLCPRFTLLRGDGTLCEGPPEGGRGCVPCVGAENAAERAALERRPAVQLERLALADEVVAPSRFLAGMFARNGFPAERTTVVPYGLEPGRVARVEVERPRTPLRVAFAGVLSPWKAPHLCVRAVRSITEPIALTIWGNVEEGMFRDYIAALREEAAGDPRIRFPGAFGEGELDAVMADADLLVVPSLWYENTPFVVLEAFEAGVPVVASDLGGLSEVVTDGVNGYLFEAGSARALADVLRACTRDPARVRDLEVRPAGTIADNVDVFERMYRG